MSEIESVLADEAASVEAQEQSAHPESPLPAHVSVTRGQPRGKNLQVRFRESEFDQLTAYAEQRGLPVSTVVRSLVVQAITPADDLRTTLDRLERDLHAVRRQALGT